MAKVSTTKIVVERMPIIFDDPIIQDIMKERELYLKMKGKEKELELLKDKFSKLKEKVSKELELREVNTKKWIDDTKDNRVFHKSYGTDKIKEYVEIQGDKVKDDFEYKGGRLPFDVICGKLIWDVVIDMNGHFILMRLKKCNHVNSVRWNNYLNGFRCKVCASLGHIIKRRLSIVDVEKEISSFGDKLLSLAYIMNRQPLRIECGKCNKTYVQTYESVTRRNPRRCYYCSHENKIEKLSTPKDEIIEILKEQDLIAVDDFKYLNAKTKFRVQCKNPKHPVFLVNFDSVKWKNVGCKLCKASTGEIKTMHVLDELKVEKIIDEYNKEYVVNKDVANNKINLYRFDFMFKINEKEYLIEFDGCQHFKVIDFSGKGEEFALKQYNLNRQHDVYKTQYCILHDIPLLRIHYKTENIKETIDKFIEISKTKEHCVYFTGNYTELIDNATNEKYAKDKFVSL